MSRVHDLTIRARVEYDYEWVTLACALRTLSSAHGLAELAVESSYCYLVKIRFPEFTRIEI